jgi:hypothetical protein
MYNHSYISTPENYIADIVGLNNPQSNRYRLYHPFLRAVVAVKREMIFFSVA